MKLVKSLLLGSAAGLAAVAGAQAADLPVKKAVAVEYVRVCSTYGAGFFYVPGTDSCLRVSGRVRMDVRSLETLTRAQDAFSTRVRGRIQLDHRTATAYGTLRTVVRFEIDRNSGRPFTDSGVISTDPKVAQAFVQFGGLTAGRVTSFFSNPDLPTAHMGTLRFDDAPDVHLLAYTFSFGNGFSATLSLEDPLSRRNSNLAVADLAAPLVYAGSRAPDLVGNLRYTGTWGGVQLSGAVHQVRDLFETDTEYGFAVGLSGYINLPSLGAGDAIWAFATYTDGATAYINGGQDSPNYSASISAAPLSAPFSDAYVNGLNGDLRTTKAWSIAGGFTHNWTPNWRSSIFGSYAQFDVPGGATVINLATGTISGLDDFNEYRVGVNTFWLPVSGLQIGVEALYTKVDPKGRVAVGFSGPGGTFVKSVGSEDIWEGRLRIQRDF